MRQVGREGSFQGRGHAFRIFFRTCTAVTFGFACATASVCAGDVLVCDTDPATYHFSWRSRSPKDPSRPELFYSMSISESVAFGWLPSYTRTMQLNLQGLSELAIKLTLRWA